MTTPFEERSLEEVVELASGQVDPREAPYCSMPHVGGDNIESHSGRITGTQTASELGLKSGKYLFDPSYILYSKIRPNLNKVAAPNFAGICSADIYPIRPVNGEIDKRFLVYVLRSKHFLAYAAKHSTRTNIPKINRPTLLGYRFPLPPLSEQKRIADILDKADAIRRKRQDIRNSARDFMQSVFDAMFGPPISNPHDWPIRPLEDVIAKGTSISYGIVQCGPEVENGVPYIRTSDMTSEVLGPITTFGRTAKEIAAKYQRSTVRAGDLVFANRASIGAIVEVPDYLDGANLTQGTTRIAPGPDVHRHYLMWLFRSAQMQQWLDRAAKGVTFREITMGRLREVPIPVPPLDLQMKFSGRYESLLRLGDKWQAAEMEATDLFNSLVQRAFKGEL